MSYCHCNPLHASESIGVSRYTSLHTHISHVSIHHLLPGWYPLESSYMAAKAGHSYRTDICQQCRTAWATLDIPWLSNFLQSLSTPDPTLSRCQTWAPTFFPWLNSPCKTPNSPEQRQKWTTGHELGWTGQRADCSVPTSNIRPSGHLIVPEPCLRSTLSAIHMTHSLVWVVKLKGAAWICLDTATTGRRLRDPHFSPLCCQELTSKFVEVKWS